MNDKERDSLLSDLIDALARLEEADAAIQSAKRNVSVVAAKLESR